jgi:hypothetical protein
MMLNVLYEGKSERTWKTSTQENSTLSWKTTERMDVTLNPALRKSEVVSSEATGALNLAVAMLKANVLFVLGDINFLN